ncbi:MAG TPA: hypothetical protein VH596_08320 [Terriglobales bacterium]
MRAQSSNSSSQSSLPDHPQPQPGSPNNPASPSSAAGAKPTIDTPWPREVDRGEEKIAMYQPQIEAWEGNQLRAYAALSVTKKNNAPKYGVVWFTAKTEIDKINRQVTMDDFQITAVNFPAMKDRESEFKAFLQTRLPTKSKVIALDRLEAGLAATNAAQAAKKGVAVKNDPPRVIFTSKPSMLVLIDGPPKFVEVDETDLQRVLNTQAVILADAKSKKYYLNVMDGWLEAPDLTAGPWAYADKTPKSMKDITKDIKEKQKDSVPEGETPPSLKKAKKEGKIPNVFVSLGPAELLVTEGAPKFERIPGLSLEYVKNSSANVFLNGSTRDYYILISGRWFQSKSLENGPWEFVDGEHLPQEFGKIPANSPKAGVLVSVPGTGPAQEALIANSIPQTATITRSQVHLDVKYDGTPQFKNIEGTDLQYAVNTATPVIRVNDKNYFGVENAVWFVGLSPTGPWVVASSVPAEIYAIPPSSPLYYVTYVKIYDSTPEVVHVGYTPGYYGTVVSSTTTTVVYGTGFYYPPYVGTYWYGAPYTYGVGVASTWSSGTGWSVTIGVGYTAGAFYYPWWGPWGYYGPCCWGTAWGYGWGGYASANVYGRWGNTAYAGTRAAWANPYTGNYGAGTRTTFQNAQTGTVGVAGRGTNTNVYTGNTRGGRGAAAYNPQTGVVAGAGAGYAGNIYSGQGVAGRGGFAYNTNTGAGVATGGNNIYAGKDGSVYRYDRQNGNWSQNTGNGWHSTNAPERSLQQQSQARSLGQQRTQNFSRSMSGARAGGRRR